MIGTDMYASTPDRHLTERLAELLDPREEILEAYLFGSHARGQAQPHSDVDVAVYVDKSLVDEGRWGYRAELTTVLMDALATNNVDVVVLKDPLEGCDSAAATVGKLSGCVLHDVTDGHDPCVIVTGDVLCVYPPNAPRADDRDTDHRTVPPCPATAACRIARSLPPTVRPIIRHHRLPRQIRSAVATCTEPT